MFYKYNVRLVFLICALVCAVVTSSNYIFEQPYYDEFPYNFWTSYQDYSNVYPSFVNSVQILSMNGYARYFY